MSRCACHTQRAAGVSPRGLSRYVLLVLSLLCMPAFALAGSFGNCTLAPPTPLAVEAQSNQTVTVSFQVVRSPTNTGVPCTAIAGTVNFEGGGTVVSVLPEGPDPALNDFVADENQTVTVTYATGTANGSGTLYVSCTSAECSGNTTDNFQYDIVVVNRTLQVVSGNPVSTDPNRSVQLQVRALDDGIAPAAPVQIAWTVSGAAPATLDAPTSDSDVNGDAFNGVTVGTAMPGSNVVTVTAARADAPGATVTFAIRITTYELAVTAPAPGTQVLGGSTVTLSTKYLVNGAPLDGVTVNWSIVQDPNGSTLQSPASSTDGSGIATNVLRVGTPNVGSPPPPIVVHAVVNAPLGLKGAATLATAVFTLVPIDVVAVSKSSGDNQSATVGAPLPAALVVSVTRNGAPDVGGTVNWSVDPAGAATLSSAQSTVNGQGNASIDVTVVNAAGPFTVTAAHNDDPTQAAVFNADGIATTQTLDNAQGDGQSGFTGTAMAQPLRIQAQRSGTPQAGIAINWTVSPAGFASVSPASSVTDSTGFAETVVTNGSSGGAYTVTATRGDNGAVSHSFGLTALQRGLDKPADSGNAQSGATGATLAQPLVAVATLNGAAQSGIGVSWSVTSGSALLSNATSPTDGAGRSSVTVTLGNTPGAVVVRAARDDDPAVFEDYTLQAFSKTLVKPGSGSGDGQSGGAGSTLPLPLRAVALRDGSPESGVAVDWSVVSGNATLSNIASPTDGSGRSSAVVSFGNASGTVVVRAARADFPTQFQDYTLVALDVRTLDKPVAGSGDGQSGVLGSELPQALVVFAHDNGLPAPGVQVNWSASNGATVVPATSTTDAAGRTEVRVRLGNAPGPVTVTATRADAGTANASFVLAATSTPPLRGIDKPSGSGDGTRFAPGESVTLVARTTLDGQPERDMPVRWTVSGSALLGSDAGISDVRGLVHTVVTAGMAPGPVLVTATHGVSGATTSYELTVTGSATGALLAILEGDGQGLPPGARGDALVVRLTRAGAPLPQAAVTWEVLRGSATLDAATSTTDADGRAVNGIQFGDEPGEVLVRATAEGSSVVFHLHVKQNGAARTLRLLSGNAQRGPLGTRADQPIVVEVVDGSGAPVAGQSIDWVVQSGNAALDAPATTTDADGRSALGFRFGNAAGPLRIRASIGTAAGQSVLVDAIAFAPTLAIVGGDEQSAQAGTLLPQELVVQIAAPAGAKSLGGIAVHWDVIDGAGTLASATSLTDAGGRAGNRYTLGAASGAQHVRASLESGAAVTFTETATAIAGPLVIVSGNDQVLPTHAPSAPLVVSLASTSGVPIRDAVLVWTADNAELAHARTTTDAQGQASNVAEVLLPGAAGVTVTVQGADGGSVVFGLEGGVVHTSHLGRPEETVAHAIDQLCPALVALDAPTPEQADLRARCLELVDNAGDHPDEVGEALDQMRQDVALAQANAAFVAARAQFDNLKTRIAALRSGHGGVDVDGLALANSSGVMPLSFLPSAVVQAEDQGEGGSAEGRELGSDFSRWGFFASGILGRGSQDGTSVMPEYDYDSDGLTAGVDYRVNDQWIVGASVGWNRQNTDLAHDEGQVETDGWSLSGYTTWYHENQWYFDGVLTFGSNDYDLERRIRYALPGAGGSATAVDQVARASTGGDQLSFALSLGRDFQRGNLSFGPYFRGMYTRVDFDAYEERLDGGIGSGLGLGVEERELKSMTAVVGGKATWALSRDWGILMPHLQLEWEHEFEDDPQQLAARFLHDPTRTAVRTQGDEVDTDFFNLGIGLSALFANGRSAFFYYEHLAGSEGLSQDNLSLGVRFEF
jgi:uncharacterized protein YhjY with autotransporter beta-barrel domain